MSADTDSLTAFYQNKLRQIHQAQGKGGAVFSALIRNLYMTEPETVADFLLEFASSGREIGSEEIRQIEKMLDEASHEFCHSCMSPTLC